MRACELFLPTISFQPSTTGTLPFVIPLSSFLQEGRQQGHSLIFTTFLAMCHFTFSLKAKLYSIPLNARLGLGIDKAHHSYLKETA